MNSSFTRMTSLAALVLSTLAAGAAQASTFRVFIAKPTLVVTSASEAVKPVAQPKLQLRPTQGLDFGSVKTGQIAQLGFVLTNSGDAPATGLVPALSGADLSLVSNNCGSAQNPGSLAAGASCAVTVQWAPTSGGPLTASLGATSSNGGALASLSLTGSATAVDAQSASLGMLLHFDGAPGSTTFVDSSSPAVNGTAVGSAALTSTVAKFGTSLATGTNSYASFPWKGSYTLKGSYTVEAWLYLRAVPVPNPRGSTCASMIVAGDLNGWQFSYCHNTGSLGIGSYGNGAGQLHTSYAMPLNQWLHIAVVRNGTNNAIYINGISQTLTANTFVGHEVPTGFLTVGSERRHASWDHDFPGYIDEVRITNGVARYTGNFTVPQAPFPNP